MKIVYMKRGNHMNKTLASFFELFITFRERPDILASYQEDKRLRYEHYVRAHNEIHAGIRTKEAELRELLNAKKESKKITFPWGKRVLP